MQYEALVEVGAGSTGGFEAESVDVSADGIRLRTAYMPDMGERLVCRFDGFGGEIVAEGEVIWRRDQGRGGEFGVRFMGLDERGAKLLATMCQPQEGAEPAAEPAEPNAFIGARVKLHIEGLGSPMRARVKDTANGEVLVGSSLEFLRVGRDVELEDVEQGRRRVALIEHVGVEIDPENSVPQLVVALRYETVAAKDDPPEPVEEHSTEPYRNKMKQALIETKPAKETTPEPTVIDADDDGPGREALPPDTAAARTAVECRAPQPNAAEAADTEIDADGEADDRLGDAGRSIGAFARKLSPKIATASSSAKSAFGTMLDAVRRKREQRKLEKSAKAPKRTTAPPPSGALRSDGRRLFREQNDESTDGEGAEVEIPKRDYKKKAVIGSVIGAIAVVAIYAGATQMSKAKGADHALAAAATAEVAATSAPDAPAPGGPVATANVPLFGATPLSTTEAVPAPPNPEALDDADGEPGAGAKDAKDGKAAPGQLQKEWGVGKVTDPVTLKLTMDGDVAGFSGAEGATGFTLVVPGRKSVSSAAGLARKDKRIDSVNVVNYPDRAEVTVHFKGGDVPAYSAKATGKRLLIEIDGKKAKNGDADDTKKKKGKGAGKGHKKHPDPKGEKTAAAADAAKADKKTDVKKPDAKKSDKKSDGKKAKKN